MSLEGALPLHFVVGFPHLWQVLSFLLTASRKKFPFLSMLCATISRESISKGMVNTQRSLKLISNYLDCVYFYQSQGKSAQFTRVSEHFLRRS